VKGIILGKNIPIECRDYPPHKMKQFRVLIPTVDLALLFHCREKPSKKAARKTNQRRKVPYIGRINRTKGAGISFAPCSPYIWLQGVIGY